MRSGFESLTFFCGQILYYWNGLEDGNRTGGRGVLQPVLQWTKATSWGIKSWFVGAGGTGEVHEKLIICCVTDNLLRALETSHQ